MSSQFRPERRVSYLRSVLDEEYKKSSHERWMQQEKKSCQTLRLSALMYMSINNYKTNGGRQDTIRTWMGDYTHISHCLVGIAVESISYEGLKSDLLLVFNS